MLNLFCYQAYYKKNIIVLGGNQVRPLLNIEDMISCYEFFIRNKLTGIFNVGFENLSINQIAKDVAEYIPTKIVYKKTNDPRSYRMNSNKLLKTGFLPKFNHIDAIKKLKINFGKGFKPTDKNWNLKWLVKKSIIKKI